LKRAMFEKIEQNSIKVNANNEEVYLKKSKVGGWHVIHPPININSVEEATDENGIINWRKVKWDRLALVFGSKSNAIATAVIGTLTILLAIGTRQIIVSFNSTMGNPIVQSCLQQAGIVIPTIS